MAIKISDYYKKHRIKSIALFAITQIIIVTIAGFAAAGYWAFFGPDMFIATLIASCTTVTILELLATPILSDIADTPLKVLSQAIAHVSKDPIQTPPPSLSKSQQRSGLKELVQTVYELAANGAAFQAVSGSTTADIVPVESVLKDLPCGVIVLNSTGEITYANGLAPVHTDSQNKRILELLFEQSDGLDNWITHSKDKIRDTKTWRRIANKIPGEEDRRIFDVIGHYDKSTHQAANFVLITIDRTTEYSPAEEDMDFIALAAHELRGPITVIRGYLDVIDQELAPALKPEDQELIDRLQVSAERLSGYINNILNVSRYDRNHLKLHLHEEKLLGIVKALVPDLALRAKTLNRSLVFHIDENLPTIAADRSSLSEVISNLIDNAIKYSHEGGEVTISARTEGNFVETTVEDNGIGMPETVVRNLFTKFYRSHRSRQQVSGTGLGLYICKAIVESHGGSIWVRSKEGKGTTFGFTMPIYSTVADKLAKSDNGNEQIIEQADGWIKNHAMYRR
jgi:two-component system phosphate regulon sensor histidine kinase PhoR/two-component system sensor histidine kinase VicK